MSMTLPQVGADSRSDATSPALVAAAQRPAKPSPSTVTERTHDKPNSSDVLKSMRKEVEQALSEANRRMQANGRALAFSLDEKADRMVIKVTNTDTGELVRQIPDETVLRISHSLDELKGLLYDQSS